MKVIVVGCGRVGSNVAKALQRDGWDVTVVDEKEEALSRLGEDWPGRFIVGHRMDVRVLLAPHSGHPGHEVTLIEQRRDRFEALENEFEHQVQHGDATELYVLERAGIARPPDIVVAATGDDEDNMVICQIAREKYGVAKVIARVNDPRNQAHFDLLGISPTVSATQTIMALIEHEVPEHELIHLLELRKENLEIVEVQIEKSSPWAGKTVEKLRLPEGSRLIS